jgi:hypothetical protein
MALRHGAPVPFEYTRWQMAERYGWTLEYIDGMSVDTLHEWYQVEDGKGKARE